MTTDRTELIRTYYHGYETDQRDLVENVVSDGFTFTSPRDDRIDRATYFAKCWPGHEQLRCFRLLQVTCDGDHALVRYQAVRYDGTSFENVEHFEFRDDHVTHIDVYFGGPVGSAGQPAATN